MIIWSEIITRYTQRNVSADLVLPRQLHTIAPFSAALLDDNSSIYVTDYQPSQEAHYRERFYIDPNAITMTNGNVHFLFYANNRAGTVVPRVEFRRNGSTYQVRAGAVNDASTWSDCARVTISDASHALEME